MTNAEARFNKSHIRKVYACLAVTCHLHIWQNDQDLIRATAVTRGQNGYQNKSQHRKSTLEKKIFSRGSCRDLNLQPFSHKSSALTTELSPPTGEIWQVLLVYSKSDYSFYIYAIYSPVIIFLRHTVKGEKTHT